MTSAVAIPCYRPTLSSDEHVSLRQCRRLLGSHACKVVLPEGMALPEPMAGMDTEYFPAHYFRSVGDYNRLLLSQEFYQRFLRYDYLLIHQLDAYVFRDELDFWCAQGFDYIGAPWGDAPFLGKRKLWAGFPWTARSLRRARLLHRRDFRVGNGGLSLRHVTVFRRFLESHAAAAARWPWNEDVFWSIAAPIYDRRFRIPAEAQAMRFSVEQEPRRCVERMDGRLPFGCHAWRKHDPQYWSPHLPGAGEAVP